MNAVARKKALKAELLEILTETLAAARRAHRSAVEGATHGEARQENDKDTRGLEQSYVARGQALRIEALQVELTETQRMPLSSLDGESPISAGALVTVEDDGRERTYFVAPHGGGVSLEQGAVQALTPRSPLGSALLRKRAGDECEVVLQGRKRNLVITRVE